MENDLFDIKVNASGKLYIRKFASIARLIILVGILISLIHIASTVMYGLTLRASDLKQDKGLMWEYRILPYYTAAYCILFYPQMYFYWQATKCFRYGLKSNDEDTFNNAFRSLFRYAVFGMASIFLSVLSYGFELYRYIADYLR